MLLRIGQQVVNRTTKVVSRLVVCRCANPTGVVKKSLAAFAVIITIMIESKTVFAIQSAPEILNCAVMLSNGTSHKHFRGGIFSETSQDIGKSLMELGASGNMVSPFIQAERATDANKSRNNIERPVWNTGKRIQYVCVFVGVCIYLHSF